MRRSTRHAYQAVALIGTLLTLGCGGGDTRPDGDRPDGNLHDASDPPDDAPPTSSNPIYFGTMLHLEGGQNFPSQMVFDRTNETLSGLLDLFAASGAILTLESELPYAEAAARFSGERLGTALAGGHGVGTHCDISRTETSTTVVTDEYRLRREAVGAIVGAENNRGCSGGWSGADWAVAAHDAGFEYLDGTVMMGLLGIPLDARPVNPVTMSPYTDDEINSTYYHDPLISDLMERTVPRRLANTDDLIGDSTGVMLLTGTLGEISSLAEGRSTCHPDCALDQDDVDTIIAAIDTVLANREPGEFNHIYLHFPLATIRPGSAGDAARATVTAWFEAMQPYVDRGDVVWSTMAGIYDAAVAAGL